MSCLLKSHHCHYHSFCSSLYQQDNILININYYCNDILIEPNSSAQMLSAKVFLYRQHVLGLEGFQQPIISIAGTIGWFSCTLIYRKKISAGRCATNTLRLCLKLWLVPLLAKALILRPTKVLVLPAALLENAANEFGKALTFLPVTVLQQLHTPAGCEGSAFTLMQAGGTLGTVIGRNFEWQLLRWCGVDMSLGAAGFSNFSVVLVVAGVWRATTALVLCLVLLPRLDAHSASKKGLATSLEHLMGTYS